MSETASATRSPIGLADLPGPRGVPLLGNLLQLDLQRLHLTLEQWVREHGPLYRFQLGRKSVVVVADSSAMFEILRDRPRGYRRLGTIEPVMVEMGVNGVFSAEGATWQRQRRIVMQAFHPGHLRTFFPTLAEITGRLVRRWQRSAGEPIDAPGELMRYTVDVTTALAFGHDMRTLEGNEDVIQRHLEQIFPAINRRVNAPFPYWHFVKLQADRAVDRALVAVHAAIREFIGRARAQQAADPAAKPRNLLEALLNARDGDGSAFSDADIAGNVFTMLLGGEDTTANTLAWLLSFLTEHPRVQAAVRDEVDRVYPRPEDFQDYGRLDQLRYVEAVAHETMRLKPVAPLLFLEANTDVRIRNVDVPKGTALFLCARPAAISEANFPDPLSFKPERWLDAGEGSGMRTAAAADGTSRTFLPFGAGPRFCPGRNLAMIEIKHVVAAIARHFTVSSADATARSIEERFAFTMMPRGLRLIATSRTR